MLKRSLKFLSRNTNSEEIEEDDGKINIKLTDFRLLTFVDNNQVIGLYLTEDDKNYFINDAHIVLSDQMTVLDEDSVGIDVIGKHAIKAVSLPNVNTVIRYIGALEWKKNQNQFELDSRNQPPFPVTQFSYLTEGRIVTQH